LPKLNQLKSILLLNLIYLLVCLLNLLLIVRFFINYKSNYSHWFRFYNQFNKRYFAFNFKLMNNLQSRGHSYFNCNNDNNSLNKNLCNFHLAYISLIDTGSICRSSKHNLASTVCIKVQNTLKNSILNILTPNNTNILKDNCYIYH